MLSLGSLGAGVRYAYTTRLGGVSTPPYDTLNLSPDVGDDPKAVAANRQLVLDRLALPNAVWLRARHGADVAIVGPRVDEGGGVGGPVEAAPEVDVVVTTQSDLAMAALSADCALVVLGDSAAGVVAAVHCGRPGLLVGTVDAAVTAMHELGANTVRAAIGPAICGSCYEVPQEMADEVCAVVPDAAARTRDGAPALDIVAGVAARLAALDVEVMRRVGTCTREDPALFSYRRDKVTGRMAALVWRSP